MERQVDWVLDAREALQGMIKMDPPPDRVLVLRTLNTAFPVTEEHLVKIRNVSSATLLLEIAKLYLEKDDRRKTATTINKPLNDGDTLRYSVIKKEPAPVTTKHPLLVLTTNILSHAVESAVKATKQLHINRATLIASNIERSFNDEELRAKHFKARTSGRKGYFFALTDEGRKATDVPRIETRDIHIQDYGTATVAQAFWDNGLKDICDKINELEVKLAFQDYGSWQANEDLTGFKQLVHNFTEYKLRNA